MRYRIDVEIINTDKLANSYEYESVIDYLEHELASTVEYDGAEVVFINVVEKDDDES